MEEDPYEKYPTMKASLKRVETCFGADGRLKIPCDNQCGRMIGITEFSAFMLPEHLKYEVLFVCGHCVRELYIKHNYGNKN